STSRRALSSPEVESRWKAARRSAHCFIAVALSMASIWASVRAGGTSTGLVALFVSPLVALSPRPGVAAGRLAPPPPPFPPPPLPFSRPPPPPPPPLPLLPPPPPPPRLRRLPLLRLGPRRSLLPGLPLAREPEGAAEGVEEGAGASPSSS